MPLHKISIRWSGKKYDLDIDTDEPALVFKSQIFTLTGVEPERQKIMIKGGLLKDDTDLKSIAIKSGDCWMMMRTASQLVKPKEDIQFVEDMTEEQLAKAIKIPPGLENLGNTCYMNATLQCLKSVSAIVNNVSRFSGSISGDNRKNVVVALRDLYSTLGKKTESVTPLVFLQVLRLAFPQFAEQSREGGFMQQDAEECWSSIVSLLVGHLGSSIESHMQGEFVHSMQCDEAENEEPSVSKESFLKLCCFITSEVNFLMNGIEASLKEKIEKQSPSLGRQSVYTKTTRINRLPSNLTVQFMRFFWKETERIKAKILRKVKFSLTLDLYPLCTRELQEKLGPAREALKWSEDNKKKQKSNHGEALSAVTIPPNLDEGSNPTGIYELSAVLTHTGRTADSGHYMAWVREGETDNWWKYDDDKVFKVTSEDILKLDGGGDWHMAYILLYKEKTIE